MITHEYNNHIAYGRYQRGGLDAPFRISDLAINRKGKKLKNQRNR